jgi:hypothetical protein
VPCRAVVWCGVVWCGVVWCALCCAVLRARRHLGTHEYLPTNHGFDFYFGAPMTQNECISNIRTPGSAKPPPGHSVFGPCPIFNGSDGTVKFQDDLSQKEYYDMIDVDEEYDAAVSGFIRGAVAKAQPFFFYFCSQ